MASTVLRQGRSWAPLTLLLGQAVAQVSALLSLFLFPWSLTTGSIAFAMYVGIMLSVTMGYHRLYSHNSWKCPKSLEYVMLFLCHIMMIGPAITWAANHREHHKFVDTEKDPHSPHYRGWLLAYFGQVLITINFKYVRDLLKNKIHRLQVKYYWQVIFVWAGILFAIDPMALLYAWLIPAGFAKLIGSLVFTYSHRGKQPHSDTWVGLITLGEGFHDVHHEQGNRKVLWHNLDVGGQLIRMIDRNARI